MSGSLNRVLLLGNLGRDAELRYLANGSPVASFSIATSETWKDKEGEKREKTEWHKISWFGDSAERIAQYLVKGRQVFVEGSIETRKWKDKEGVDRTTVEIKARNVQLLGGGDRDRPREGSETRGETRAADPGESPRHPFADETVPF